jgi:hypothetical protein
MTEDEEIDETMFERNKMILRLWMSKYITNNVPGESGWTLPLPVSNGEC